jgi:membrane associated rhomboid family serine protease
MSYTQYRPNAFPPVVKNLVIINILVWAAQVVFDPKIQLTSYLALYPYSSDFFNPYQLLTHMFAHASYNEAGGVVIMHILFNMFGLWMFGRVLENVWGQKRFLFFYIACGIGAAIVHLLLTEYFNEFSAAIGASGAIMGIFAAFAYLFPNTELFIMFIPVPVKAKWAVILMAAYDLFSGVGRFAGDNVAHFAHLGGALTGFIIVLIWNKTQKRKFY